MWYVTLTSLRYGTSIVLDFKSLDAAEEWIDGDTDATHRYSVPVFVPFQ